MAALLSPAITQHSAAGMDPEERSKWAKIWEDFPILENVYLQRREAQPGVRRQLRADAAARGERVEECNSANGADQLTDFSKDLSMLAKQSKLEVSRAWFLFAKTFLGS